MSNLKLYEYKVAGACSVKWVAKGKAEKYLNSGLYICRLETGINDIIIKETSLLI